MQLSMQLDRRPVNTWCPCVPPWVTWLRRGYYYSPSSLAVRSREVGAYRDEGFSRE